MFLGDIYNGREDPFNIYMKLKFCTCELFFKYDLIRELNSYWYIIMQAVEEYKLSHNY